MSVIDSQPQSLQYLSGLNFDIRIKKCPAVNFFTQEVKIPGVSLPSPSYNNPFATINVPGEKLRFDPLDFTFKVDEQLQNYQELFNWLKALGFPESWAEYAAIEAQPVMTGTGIKSDITVFISDSAKNPKFEVQLKDCFPIKLSGFSLSSTSPEVPFITASATFLFTNYIFVPVT